MVEINKEAILDELTGKCAVMCFCFRVCLCFVYVSVAKVAVFYRLCFLQFCRYRFRVISLLNNSYY